MRRLVAAGAVLVVLVLVFGVGQLVLPGIAASMLKSRLSKNGQVISVSVSAFPAIELLWHDADTVDVRMASYRSGSAHLSSLLDQAAGVGTLHATIGTLHAGDLVIHDARLIKRGDQLSASAQISESALRTAIPFLDSASYVSSGPQGLVLDGTGTFAIVTATVQVTVHADDGKLVVTPSGLLGLLSFTVFDNPQIDVESVGGSPISGGLALSASGRFR
jgi:hypothetical protein